MRRTIVLTFLLLGFLVTVNAQNTGSNSSSANDTLKNNISVDTAKNQTPTFLRNNNGIVPDELAGNLILNISRMLFWPTYGKNFVIGVTDRKLELYLRNYFNLKKIHGKAIDVVLVNKNAMPEINVLYVTANKRSLIPQLSKYYNTTSTVIISESPSDIQTVSFVVVKIISIQGDAVFTYKFNYNKLVSKKIVPSPELRAYAVR